MATKIKGNSEILYIWDGSAYVPVGCLTSNGLSEVRNAIESVTKCDPDLTIRKAGTYSYEISFEGEFVEPDAARESWNELKALIRTVGSSEVIWRITTTYANASTLNEYGTAIITALDKTSPAGDEFITYSGTLSGSGAISNSDPNA